MVHAKKTEYYQQLISRHKGIIFRVCRIYGDGDAEFMRDLFQDISLALWDSMDRYKGLCEESTWVWRVAQKTSLYSLRKRSAERAVVQTGITEEMAETPVADNSYTDIEELYRAIAQLEADDQLLVSLRLDGKSYKEIAEQMGVDERVLRTRHTRIVQRLREIMTR